MSREAKTIDWQSIQRQALLFAQESKPDLFVEICLQPTIGDRLGSYLCNCDQKNLAKTFPIKLGQCKPCVNDLCCERMSNLQAEHWAQCPFCKAIRVDCPPMYRYCDETNQLVQTSDYPFSALSTSRIWTDYGCWIPCWVSTSGSCYAKLPKFAMFTNSEIKAKAIGLCKAEQMQSFELLIGTLEAWMMLADSVRLLHPAKLTYRKEGKRRTLASGRVLESKAFAK